MVTVTINCPLCQQILSAPEKIVKRYSALDLYPYMNAMLTLHAMESHPGAKVSDRQMVVDAYLKSGKE